MQPISNNEPVQLVGHAALVRSCVLQMLQVLSFAFLLLLVILGGAIGVDVVDGVVVGLVAVCGSTWLYYVAFCVSLCSCDCCCNVMYCYVLLCTAILCCFFAVFLFVLVMLVVLLILVVGRLLVERYPGIRMNFTWLTLTYWNLML